MAERLFWTPQKAVLGWEGWRYSWITVINPSKLLATQNGLSQ